MPKARNGKRTTFTISVTEEEHERIKADAAAQGMKVSAFIRAIYEAWEEYKIDVTR